MRFAISQIACFERFLLLLSPSRSAICQIIPQSVFLRSVNRCFSFRQTNKSTIDWYILPLLFYRPQKEPNFCHVSDLCVRLLFTGKHQLKENFVALADRPTDHEMWRKPAATTADFCARWCSGNCLSCKIRPTREAAKEQKEEPQQQLSLSTADESTQGRRGRSLESTKLSVFGLWIVVMNFIHREWMARGSWMIYDLFECECPWKGCEGGRDCSCNQILKYVNV